MKKYLNATKSMLLNRQVIIMWWLEQNLTREREYSRSLVFLVFQPFLINLCEFPGFVRANIFIYPCNASGNKKHKQRWFYDCELKQAKQDADALHIKDEASFMHCKSTKQFSKEVALSNTTTN